MIEEIHSSLLVDRTVQEIIVLYSSKATAFSVSIIDD